MAFDFPAAPIEGQMFAPVGGPLYVFNSPAWKVAGITTIPGEWKIVQTVITTGTGPYIKPANLAYLEVTIVAGGGGSGATAAAAAGNSAASGGGGGGGTAIKLYAASDLAASEPYSIGSGGANGAVGSPGGAGGVTAFKGLSASGGNGGALATVVGTTLAGSQGGQAGVGSGGDLNLIGDGGGTGIRAAHGGPGTIFSGSGGRSFFGGGRSGVFANGSSAQSGLFPGGGASGAGSPSGGSAVTGGVGADGCIILREYYPAWVLDAAYAPGTIVETLYTAPSTTWNKPAGLKYLEVEGVGPGGGGGAAIGTAAGQGSAGSGAGAGAYGKKLFKASDLPASVTITVGSPGTNSIDGGTSTFGALLSLGGGLRGLNTTAVPNTAISGGLGGVASGFDINGVGMGGTQAYIVTPGSVPVILTGQGGSTPFGAGGRGLGSLGSAAGLDAPGYGGGGGGGVNNVSQGTSKAGGTGGASIFRIREIY